MRAGTTSLHAYLGQHPEIHMSPVKEPHFFARAEDGTYGHRVADRGSYERLFESPLAVRGESSPTYSLYPKHREVPKRIAELVPEAKFLYLVRDPIDRVVSHYLHNVATGSMRSDFATAVGDLSDPNNPYVYPSLYAMQLEQYLRYFALDAVLVVDQAELACNRTASLRKIFEFLGVERDFESDAFREEQSAAATRRQYPRGYEQFLNQRVSSPVRLIPRRIRRSSRRFVERVLWPPLPRPTVTASMQRQIERVCGRDVARLRNYTGLKFESWQI